MTNRRRINRKDSNMKTSRKPLAFAMALLLVLASCTSSQVITNLQIALDAISAGLPILAGITGVPANTVTAVETYITATNSALGKASTILAGPGTDAEKAAQIAAAFANIALPVVPSQYAAIAALVATVAGDVAQFLASVPASTPAVAAKTATPAKTTSWSAHDKEMLAKCSSTANSNAVKLLGLRK